MASVRIRKVLVKELRTDEHYARKINMSKVQKIKSHFDPKGLNVFTVSERKDGELIVVDGNHRLTALRQMNRHEMTVEALVFSGLSLAEEADVFALTNDDLAAHGAARFHALVVANKPIESNINQILKENKIYVVQSQAALTKEMPLGVSAVQAIYAVFHAGHLPDVAEVASKAFLHRSQDQHERMVPALLWNALNEMFHRWPDLEGKWLSKTLTEKSPTEWLKSIRNVSQSSMSPSRKVAVEILVRAYNHGRNQGNRLRLPPRWRPVLS